MNAAGMAPAPGLPAVRFTLAQGLVFSLAVHGALVLPWLTGDWLQPAPRHEQLVVELFGMVSKRQVTPQLAGETPRPVTQPRQAPPPTPRQQAERKPPAPAAASPVKVKQAEAPSAPPDAPPPQASAATPAPAPPSTEPIVAAGADALQNRNQQTVQRPQDEIADPADLMRKYLGSLRHAIQEHLVYPPEARDIGYVGSPVIRFTLAENGEILPGSLAVHKSSGYPVLDDNALRAALASSPFGRPPRQMEITMAVAFARER